ncbi:hypothetical protein PSTT_04467 [Puccinia striiformis]|uniref:Uncharacterized protein n=1 Tax=Puccinia striiformis TaxID=27350 RepID=A0A2S4VSG4_9BASI|nr:hypothetical protein PSTT_04467 [Puccinia striiformis]
MASNFVCLGIIYCSPSHITSQTEEKLLRNPKTHWASLRPNQQDVSVHIPTHNIPVGYIPPPLKSLILLHLKSPTQFGPLGDYKNTSIPVGTLCVESILRVQLQSIPRIELALTFFSPEKSIAHILNQFLEIEIFPKTPRNYQPHEHLGCQLANLPQELTISQAVDHNYRDPQLLNIPSGCDLSPIYPSPHIIKSQLLQHQAQGLAFMIDRESPYSISGKALWTQTTINGTCVWKHKVSGIEIELSQTSNVPETPRGSILADDMGLGKSLQAICLVACSLKEAQLFSTQTSNLPNSSLPFHGTLLYHGPQRHTISEKQMEAANILITSYEIVRSDFNEYNKNFSLPKRSWLFGRIWFRVILDEAHSIRTTESKTQMAIQALKKERSLCLTGTPLQNSLHDIMALLNFLCCNLKTPHNNWPKILKPHLQQGNINQLQLILRHVMLRRTKKLSLTNFPDITHHKIKSPLNLPAQRYYDIQFIKFMKDFGNINPSIQPNRERSFFSYLHSLQGICDHPLLADPTLSIIKDGQLSPNPTEQPDTQFAGKSSQTITHCIPYEVCCQSNKIQKLLKMVHPESPLMANSTKAVVFSTWTRFLDLIGIALEQHQISFLRLDGSLNSKMQDRCLENFKQSTNTCLLLASLQTAGVGLNITHASVAFIMEPHWNPTAEAQAFDRLHRIGQTKPVQVFHFITPDTIEERILQVQERKKQLIESTILTTTDWRELLEAILSS